MMIQILAAIVGTVAFSLLFGVPRQYYVLCGAIGGIGWAVYSFSELAFSEVISVLIATMVVIFLSRIAAVVKRCPATLFLIPGIFPLVPGARVYWTTYYIVADQVTEAAETGIAAVKIAVAIVLGIVFVFEIPQSFFIKIFHRKGYPGH